jgi:Icc-related predicted phosphoesterase
MIIHGGDVSGRGAEGDVMDFIDWFCSLDCRYRIFIAGNHDFHLERTSASTIQRLLHGNAYYLCDSGIEIEGLKFWGSPISPFYHNWAFNRIRGQDIMRHWALIPDDTDVLITHGPPAGILDLTAGGVHAGCEDLLQTVRRIRPRYHLFGHIHEAYGKFSTHTATFINGSVLDFNHQPANRPVIIRLKK